MISTRVRTWASAECRRRVRSLAPRVIAGLTLAVGLPALVQRASAWPDAGLEAVSLTFFGAFLLGAARVVGRAGRGHEDRAADDSAPRAPIRFTGPRTSVHAPTSSRAIP